MSFAWSHLRRADRLGRPSWLALSAAGLVGLSLTPGTPTHAAPLTVTATDAPTAFDRWNYPFNFTPGTRGAAPTFFASGFSKFDERDGQFLIGFDTASLGVPTGRDPGDYQIQSLSVTATHSTGSFDYDPTYDSYTTYLDSADPNFTADADAGRPIVLTGAGLRNGFNEFTFGAGSTTAYAETSPFGGDGTAGTRNAFAADFDSSGNLRDIGNNVGTNAVTSGFDINPWAVGTTNLNPGDPVVEAVASTSPGSTFTFTIDLTDADILSYVQEGFAEGGLFFSITSLHPTSQSGGTNPNFYTSDNTDPAAIAPQASFDVTVVPEPASALLLAFGGTLGLARPRRRSHVTRPRI